MTKLPSFWPDPLDYATAVQNPSLAFEDPDLANGDIWLDARGLPVVASGGFAVVFRIQNDSRNWAVKCFTRRVTDQRERYAEISNFLRSVSLPFLVPFRYEERGVRVRGSWFPVVKMEWIEAPTLNLFLPSHATERKTMEALAARWLSLNSSMAKAGLAHGDLQHGNVLVHGDGLKLIDYDGAFVPSLAGRPPDEVGHRNYQPPWRDRSDFGPDMDRFSALLILSALYALIEHPSLWERYGNEENLLFSAADLAAPQKSPLFKTLESSNNKHLRDLVGSLKRAALARAQLPALEDVVRGARVSLSDDGWRAISTQAKRGARRTALPWWMESETTTQPTKPKHERLIAHDVSWAGSFVGRIAAAFRRRPELILDLSVSPPTPSFGDLAVIALKPIDSTGDAVDFTLTATQRGPPSASQGDVPPCVLSKRTAVPLISWSKQGRGIGSTRIVTT